MSGQAIKRTAPPSLRPAPAYLTPRAADAAIDLMDRLGVQPRSPQERVVAMLRDLAGNGDAPARPVAPRPRLCAPNGSRSGAVKAHPMERTAPAIAFLRNNGVSVSCASSSIHHGTRWHVSGYGAPLDALELIAVAERKGFGL